MGAPTFTISTLSAYVGERILVDTVSVWQRDRKINSLVKLPRLTICYISLQETHREATSALHNFFVAPSVVAHRTCTLRLTAYSELCDVERVRVCVATLGRLCSPVKC